MKNKTKEPLLNEEYIRFTEFLKKIERFAVNTLEKDGFHVPIVISVSDEGIDSMSLDEIFGEMQDLQSEDDRVDVKNSISELMSSFLRVRESFAYIFISECWYCTDSSDKGIKDVVVRNRSDKEEALNLVWEYKDDSINKSGANLIPFYRHDDDTITVLKDAIKTKKNDYAIGGRFTGLL